MMFKRNRKMRSRGWMMSVVGLAGAYFLGREYGRRMNNSAHSGQDPSSKVRDSDSDYPSEI